MNKNKDKRARIFYPWWGNANYNNKMWCLLAPNGELEDYGSKEHCVKLSEKNGWKYQVERWSRKNRGEMTIIYSN